MAKPFERRKILTGMAASLTALPLAGCDLFSDSPAGVPKVLDSAERLTRYAQRLLLSRRALAREFTEADISPHFRANGSTDPDDPAYVSSAQSGFKDWRLELGGLVNSPLSLSLDDLRAMPSRTQITRHDCVEGWSCIGKWKGTPLAAVLAAARVKPEARYVVFRCADNMAPQGAPTQRYYESLDLLEATHPQTILAYELNNMALPVKHGAPVRLRAERQLGYKMAKFINEIEVVAELNNIAGGRGGYWEDRGYSWYGGI